MDKAVRGSPIIRTLVVALFLALTALALARLTREKPEQAPQNTTPTTIAETTQATPVPFQMQLSATARSVVLMDLDGAILYQQNFPTPQAECSGQLSALPLVLVVKVTWDAAQPHYFAKMRLEPAGRETMMQVFDASSDMEETWELP